MAWYQSSSAAGSPPPATGGRYSAFHFSARMRAEAARLKRKCVPVSACPALGLPVGFAMPLVIWPSP